MTTIKLNQTEEIKVEESVKQLIQKVHNLTERGATEGEKLAAAQQLERLLKKYNLTIEEVLEEKKDFYRFTFKTRIERNLIIQVTGKVTNKREVTVKNLPRKLYVELTEAEYKEVKWLYDVYLTAFRDFMKKEQDILFDVFIHKNKIFSQSNDDNEEEPELTPEQKKHIQEMIRRMNNIEPVSVYKRLED